MNEIKSVSSLATASGAGGATHMQAQHRQPIAVSRTDAGEPAVQNQASPVDNETVKKLVDQANARLTAAANQSLSFGYEERLNRLYVQIKDNATGEVVREIPPKKLIEQQAALSEMIGMILDRNA